MLYTKMVRNYFMNIIFFYAKDSGPYDERNFFQKHKIIYIKILSFLPMNENKRILAEGSNDMDKYYIIEDICVICGKPVPEGTMVCPACMKKTMERKLIREDGIDETKSGRNRRYH